MGNTVGQSLSVFYVDDGILGSCYPELVQGGLKILLGMFQQICFTNDTDKSKTMTCHLVAVILGMSVEAFYWCSTG